MQSQSQITYEIIDSEILVTVPFVIKDDFKAHFKTAKWLNSCKKWVLKKRKPNIDKLDTFIQTVNESNMLQSKLEMDEKGEEYQFQDDELDALKSQYRKLKSDFETKKDHYEKLVSEIIPEKKELAEKVNELQGHIDKISDKLSEAQNEKNKHLSDIKVQLSKIIDFEVVDNFIDEINSLARLQTRQGFLYAKDKHQVKPLFKNIKKYVDALNEAGLRSEHLIALNQINLNRLDRDVPGSKITIDSIVETTKKFK